MAVEIFEDVLAEVDAVEQDLAFGWIVETGDEFDDGGLALTVFADEGDSFSGREGEVEVLENGSVGTGIGEGDVAELEAASDWIWSGKAVGFREDGWLHVEEGDEVGEEERLIGDAGGSGEDLLEVGAGLLNGGGEESELADVVSTMEGAPDDVDVGSVVPERADDAEKATDDELRSGEGDVFDVYLVGERLKSVGEEFIEAEELYFFCSFAASGYLAKVVHLALGGSLAEVFGVAEEGVVGFAEERWKNAEGQQEDKPWRGQG